jgi:8-oxo-dGTP diphosphatase
VSTTAPAAVRAAGVVVFRPGRRVLLVHRPRYDDWSFPKGKLDPGEHPVAAAVRETEEETGLHVRLTRPLADQQYQAAGRPKTVRYWTGRVVGDDDLSGYQPNHEIDDLRWVRAEDAARMLSYERDRETLAEALAVRARTTAVVVLRHAEARSRKAWRGDDRDRPLLERGHDTTQRLVPLLAAYDVTRVVTSASVRCVQTVAPFAETAGWEVEPRRRLTEEDAKEGPVRRLVADALADGRGTVVCSHRPVLPLVFDALGLADPGLAPGELAVAHVRKGRVTVLERHLPR